MCFEMLPKLSTNQPVVCRRNTWRPRLSCRHSDTHTHTHTCTDLEAGQGARSDRDSVCVRLRELVADVHLVDVHGHARGGVTAVDATRDVTCLGVAEDDALSMRVALHVTSGQVT